MRVKSFYGANIKEALDKARRELGPDAAIVASRQVRPDEGVKAACEVICGVPESHSAAAMAPAMPAAAAQPASERPASRGFAKIRKPVEAVREAVSRSQGKGAQDDLAGLISASGFSPDIARDILAGARQRERQFSGKGRGPAPAAEELLNAELASRLRVAPELGRKDDKCKVVALVGPPGAGKTTTLVKLAAQYGIAARRSMHIISMDAWRIGGSDALRAYAAAMATSFEALETAHALAGSLQEHAGRGLILIDTAGLGPADLQANGPLATVLSRHTGIDVHLVLPATMSADAMSGTVTRFRPFLPSKLLVTNLDAVSSCRAAVVQAIEHDKPVSFLGTGQVVPEDLVEATAARLLGQGCSAVKQEAISAA